MVKIVYTAKLEALAACGSDYARGKGHCAKGRGLLSAFRLIPAASGGVFGGQIIKNTAGIVLIPHRAIPPPYLIKV